MSKRAGWRKFDEIVCEDGMKALIRCNTETGEFMIEIPDPENGYRPLEKFQGKKLNELRAEALQWLKDHATLNWEAFIIVRGATKWNGKREFSDEHLDLHYSRFFRGKRKDGSFLWKSFTSDGKDEAAEDDVKGKPGRTLNGDPGTFDEDSLVLPYTPERWSGLRSISFVIRQVNERIQGFLDKGQFDHVLASIAQRGMMALLPAPKEKA